MKYIDRPEVYPELREQSKKQIDICNQYVDDLHGTIVTIKTIQCGQTRPYADSVYESLIFCFQPNVYTTNGPCGRQIDEAAARMIARLFVRDWGEHETPYLGGYLSFIRPEKDPAELDEKVKRGYLGDNDVVRSSCWRVRVIMPFCD